MKIGRPIIGQKRLDKRIDIRLSNDMLKFVAKYGKKYGKSRTQVIRDAIKILKDTEEAYKVDIL